VYESGASANNAAFVGEGGLQCKYQVTNGITLKLGYEVLWLSGVALAPGQIQETYTIYSPTGVNTLDVNSRSSVLFHGVTAGLEFSF
jgi:opacity protein-like surface antigen